MTRQYRIAVLECDTPMEPIVAKYGTYGDIFETFLRHGLKTYAEKSGCDVELVVTKANMVDMGALPVVDEVDCILLTGSKHNAFDNDAWILRLIDYLRDVKENTRIPIVGMCFGHQLIARALGGRVSRSDRGWEVAVSTVNLTPEGKALFAAETLALHQMHRDVVTALPEGAVNLGFSDVCEYQGIYIPGRVFTLQGHPEFNETIMSILLDTRAEQGVFEDAVYKSGTMRSGRKHDGLKVSESVWRLLLGSTYE